MSIRTDMERELARIQAVSGRGLLLMRTFMDEVTFNETGNEVTMIKRCSAAAGKMP